MIISHENLDKPESYRESIRQLGKAGILPEQFSERFEKAAALRKVLVHQYAEIDIEKLHKHLTQDLEDFDAFAKHVAKYAAEQP